MPEEIYKGARGNDYGSPAEQREWMKKGTQQRKKANLMRQFVTGDGVKGATPEYRENYDRIFGGEK